jgi:hypothetical protein
MLTERQNETAFLKRCLEFGGNEEGRHLCQRMIQVHRDQRCLWRAICLMILLAALSGAGLVYATILNVDFRENELQLGYKAMFGLFLASLFCIATFGCLLLVYHRNLNRLRRKCRRVIANLLEACGAETHVPRPNGELAELEIIAFQGGLAAPESDKTSLPGAS